MLLGDIIDFNARKYPGKIAASCQGKAATWSQFQARINQISNALQSIANPGDSIALWSQNNYEYMEILYGIPMGGMVTTVINYRLNPKEIEWIIKNSEASVLIIEKQYLSNLNQIEMPSVKHVISIGGGPNALGYETWITSASFEKPELNIKDDNLCALVYTSGTTGKPKGAMITHKNLITSAYNQLIEWQVTKSDVFHFPFPLAHISFHAMITYHLRGCPVYVMRNYDPDSWLADVENYGVTSSSLAPTMLNMLVNHPEINKYDLSSLKALLIGGSGIPEELLKLAMDKFGNILMEGFGMTELAGNIICLDFEDHESILKGKTHLLKSTGRTTCGVSTRVVDDAMNDVMFGKTGELVVRGDQVCKGYWRNPAATSEAFAGGWFHTGDMATMDEEGYYYIVDRKKDMIITGGENVYCKEVEDVIYRDTAVFEVAVFGIPDPKWGESVVAAVALKPGRKATEEEIINLCLENLARYKRPKKIVFVEAIPKNTSGKILKRELREKFVNLFD